MPEPSDPRARILEAAIELLSEGGHDAVSTRAVGAAAGVQAPTIYRQFGDMQGLLDAAAHEVFARYMREKAARRATKDPVAELRKGWDLHVAFGLENPAAYRLLYGADRSRASEGVVADGLSMLRALVQRIAESGRLRVTVPRATEMIHAGAAGVTLSLLGRPEQDRDVRLSSAMRDAVLAAILTEAEEPRAKDVRLASRAVALRASLGDARGVLSTAEREMLGEWLDRLAGDRD